MSAYFRPRSLLGRFSLLGETHEQSRIITGLLCRVLSCVVCELCVCLCVLYVCVLCVSSAVYVCCMCVLYVLYGVSALLSQTLDDFSHFNASIFTSICGCQRCRLLFRCTLPAGVGASASQPRPSQSRTMMSGRHNC